jgi:hypothetical protein
LSSSPSSRDKRSASLDIRANSGNFACILVDIARVQRLARAREHLERQVRLRYPNAKAKLRDIKQAEQRARNGEPDPVKPRVILQAPEITEADLRRACSDMARRGPREPYRRRSA